MERCVIVGGAEIKSCERLRKELRPSDFMIYCDSGLYHEEGLQRKADLIIGDFDSHPAPKPESLFSSAGVITLPTEKDYTDTGFAVKEALKTGFSDFLFLGVVGGRADHTLCNISFLLTLDSMGKSARLLDDYGETEVLSAKPDFAVKGKKPGEDSGKAAARGLFIPDTFKYFSLVNAYSEPSVVSLRGAKYPLEDFEVKSEGHFGLYTSNEPLEGGAWAEVKKGRVLVIKIFPENIAGDWNIQEEK